MASAAERPFVALALALALVAAPAIATAQSTSAAEALFEDGRRLMKDGDYLAACAKFQESQRLDPAGGTLMNLAGCHAKAGKTATAWAEFNDALAQAKRDKRADRVAEASKQIAELSPLLARLTVSVDAPARPGLEVRLDGTLLGAPSFGTALPVDPGPHELVASAPGYAPFQQALTIEAAGSKAVRVPVLGLAAAPARADAGPAPIAPIAPHRPVSAFVVGGVGLVGIGLGATFGVIAASKKNESDPHCITAGCDKTGLALLREANTSAWVSDIGVGVGAASLAVATYLFFSTPSRPAPVAIAPVVAPGSFGLGARSAF